MHKYLLCGLLTSVVTVSFAGRDNIKHIQGNILKDKRNAHTIERRINEQRNRIKSQNRFIRKKDLQYQQTLINNEAALVSILTTVHIINDRVNTHVIR